MNRKWRSGGKAVWGLAGVLAAAACIAGLSGEASAAARPGKPGSPSWEEEEAMKGLKEQLEAHGRAARIVWSTSRESGRHDIFIMNADGSDKKALTQSDHVDWFPRFSGDGRSVIYCRSKRSWESETNAKHANRWNIWQVAVDGTGETEIIENAVWGTWTPDGKILFSRGPTAHVYDPETKEEKLLIDGAAHIQPRVVLQQPQLSPDGKYVAITLRGRKRETGIWDLGNETWTKVAGGCQINWFPSGERAIRVNENTGRGKTEIFAFDVKDGAPVDERPSYNELRFMDLPGRRSHEYFPQFSRDGNWLVWCATDRGHDHDIYDYEVFIWRVGTPPEEAARLTFHTGNDRWPDIFVPVVSVVPDTREQEPEAGADARGRE